MIEEKPKLVYGVEFGGVIHRVFDVRLPVIKDTIAALTDTQDACGETESPAANMRYRVAVMASALVSLGNIPKEDITPTLLLDGLVDTDLDIINAAIADAKKKRLAAVNSLPDIEPLSSPSVNAASVNSK
ncbi:hypothetical protein [Limnobaculum xujianqingii]|uniref:hypothetical protein n=1 Tax=Limnobaculum xujianqingii TaxID=2738837 RepID=UPI001E43BE6D|nr:hypothetical protein [Limnobaculum xujianqingii]